MQADSFRFGVWDADYPSQSTTGFLRLWVHQSRNCFLFDLSMLWQKKSQLASILISLLNDFGSHLVEWCSSIPFTAVIPWFTWWGNCLGSGGVYSLHSHTERRKITLVWALCPGDLGAWVTWVCGVCTGGWILILFRVIGGIIWRLQRPYSFSSCVLDPGLSALWKNLNHSPKLHCSPVWLRQRHRRCHCLVIAVHRWPSLLMDL